MMTETHNGNTFHCSSDLSGKVIITDSFGSEVKVDGESLLYFFAQYVRRERIKRLENLSNDDVIGEALR